MKAAVLALAVVLGFTASVFPKTIVVDISGGGDYTEISACPRCGGGRRRGDRQAGRVRDHRADRLQPAV